MNFLNFKSKIDVELKDPLVLHPFLFSAYAVLNLFVTNMDEMSIKHLTLPLISSIAATLALYLILLYIFKEKNKAALITFIICVFFFSFGHLYEFISILYKKKSFHPMYLFIPYIFIAFLIVRLLLKIRSIKHVNHILNGVVIILAASSIVQIVFNEITKKSLPPNLDQNTAAVSKEKPQKSYPDIYYIIPDGYASPKMLKRFYGFDNSDFTENLKKLGFFLAQDSKANYPRTLLSIASSMNGIHLDHLTDLIGADSNNLLILTKMVNESWVINFLHRLGYNVINYCSGQDPTILLPSADKNILTIERKNEILELILATSMLKIFFYDSVSFKLEMVPKTFHEIEKNIPFDSPKFVLAHIISPHPPFTFDKNGKRIHTKSTLTEWNDDNQYLDEIIFVNKKILDLINSIVSVSKIKPVIVIQGDHGSIINGLSSESNLLLRSSILNAYLVPESCKKNLYGSITPVNSFRVIFNCLFGTRYNLLRDEIFTSRLNKPYRFKNITKLVSK